MTKLALMMILTLGLAGCTTISKEALQEVSDSASAGDNVLTNWTTLSDDDKKHALWTLTRTPYDVLNSVRGDPIPDRYITNPWKPTVLIPEGGK